jgi:hypothetical protein
MRPMLDTTLLAKLKISTIRSRGSRGKDTVIQFDAQETGEGGQHLTQKSQQKRWK